MASTFVSAVILRTHMKYSVGFVSAVQQNDDNDVNDDDAAAKKKIKERKKKTGVEEKKKKLRDFGVQVISSGR